MKVHGLEDWLVCRDSIYSECMNKMDAVMWMHKHTHTHTNSNTNAVFILHSNSLSRLGLDKQCYFCHINTDERAYVPERTDWQREMNPAADHRTLTPECVELWRSFKMKSQFEREMSLLCFGKKTCPR